MNGMGAYIIARLEFAKIRQTFLTTDEQVAGCIAGMSGMTLPVTCASAVVPSAPSIVEEASCGAGKTQ